MNSLNSVSHISFYSSFLQCWDAKLRHQALSRASLMAATTCLRVCRMGSIGLHWRCCGVIWHPTWSLSLCSGLKLSVGAKKLDPSLCPGSLPSLRTRTLAGMSTLPCHRGCSIDDATCPTPIWSPSLSVHTCIEVVSLWARRPRPLVESRWSRRTPFPSQSWSDHSNVECHATPQARLRAFRPFFQIAACWGTRNWPSLAEYCPSSNQLQGQSESTLADASP